MKMKGQQIVDLQPEVNSSGRIKTLNVVGTKTTVAVDGATLRKRLNLRSTWFTVGVLSLSAPSAPVTYGSRLRLNGLARGMAQAELQQLQSGAWTAVGTVKAGSTGTLSFVVKPTLTTRYRLTSGKVAAAPVRVPVAPLARLYPVRTPDQLSGYVRPATLAGTTVLIQRQQGTAWPTVVQATVGADGDFLAKLPLSTGVYRARIASGHGFVVGFSPVLQVTTS
jgi:hypothetical protein